MSTEFDVTQFGIQPEDEFTHPFSADHPDWNESYFFDWYDASGTNAGCSGCGLQFHWTNSENNYDSGGTMNNSLIG